MGLLGRIFGKREDAPGKDGGGADAGGASISNRDLARAIKGAEDDPEGILKARLMIEQMGDSLSNAERAEAYRRLSAAPRYRNQRDNTKDPDSTCNFTSMAMAFGPAPATASRTSARSWSLAATTTHRASPSAFAAAPRWPRSS